jgi:Thiazole biosynthesis protein ThiG
VTVNGQRWELPDGFTLADPIERLDVPRIGVAVALNGALTRADDPPQMAEAMRLAVQAGRHARLHGSRTGSGPPAPTATPNTAAALCDLDQWSTGHDRCLGAFSDNLCRSPHTNSDHRV